MKMQHANASWITDTLATGGDLGYAFHKAAQRVEDIVQSGITHIIDMRSEANDHEVWSEHGVRYVWLPTDDRHGHAIPQELFDEAIRVARDAEREGGKVLVHCHMGINRGPSVAYAVMLDRGYGIEEAWDMIRTARPVAMLYYAQDALKAHHHRRLVEKRFGFDASAERERLRKHVASSMSEEVVDSIQHIMATNHENDRREYIEETRRRAEEHAAAAKRRAAQRNASLT